MSGPRHQHVEPTAAPSPPGSVVLDIGGDVGALLLHTPLDLVGAEIEIRPSGGAWDGTHTGVRARHVAGAARSAALFGSLPAGPYDLRLRGALGPGPALRTRVAGGRVTEADWPD